MPWDNGGPLQHGTVLRDPLDGKWKAWGAAVPNGTFDRRLVYYESDDGVDWQRPELELHAFGEYRKTNILLYFDSGGTLPSTASEFAALPDLSLENAEPRQLFLIRASIPYNDIAFIPFTVLEGVTLSGQAFMRHE